MKTDTHFIISPSFLLRKRNVSETFGKHSLHYITFFLKILSLLRYAEKHCTAGEFTDDNMAHAHCMLVNYGYKHTPRICNTYCCSCNNGCTNSPQCYLICNLHCLPCLKNTYFPFARNQPVYTLRKESVQPSCIPRPLVNLPTKLITSERIPTVKGKVIPLQARCGPQGG